MEHIKIIYSTFEVLSGDPQGLVFEPLLFNDYIKNLRNYIRSLRYFHLLMILKLAARHGRGTAWARQGNGMLCVNRPLVL